MKAHELLSREEMQYFVRPSNLRGWQAVLTTWGIIAGSFLLLAFYPNALCCFIALILLGGRILALAILMHDASHYSLFKSRWLNDWVGEWLCAAPVWQDLRRYRKHHMAHHQFAGTEMDPDKSLVTGFPISRASLLRKILRDLSGISGLKRVYGLLLMDFGFIEYTVANDVRPISQLGRAKWTVLKAGLKNLYPVVLMNLAIFMLLFACHHPWFYGIWVLAYLITFSLIVRIRSIAEHACTDAGLDPLLNTRATYASPFARLTVAPHHVNYHLEHHLIMITPSFLLPKLHQVLKNRGALRNAHLAKNYLEVLRIATTASKQ